MSLSKYPKAKYAKRIGHYRLFVGSGYGNRYDEVLEYRVWVRYEHTEEEHLVCYCFATYEEAKTKEEEVCKAGCVYAHLVVLVLQKWYWEHLSNVANKLDLKNERRFINEEEYVRMNKERLTEYCVEWL